MLRKYCENACFDGIQELYESRNEKLKFVFWSFIMILMSFASTWFTYRTILGYLDSPTVTSVTAVRFAKIEMPEVLICYNGGLNVLAMREANLSDNLIKTFHTVLYGVGNNPSDINITFANFELEAYLRNTTLGIKEFVQRFSYSCTDIVTQTIFLALKSDGCQQMTGSFATPKGNCFLFANLGNQSFPALNGGIFLKLKLPKNSFFQVYPDIARDLDLGNDFSITLEKMLGGEESFRSIIVAPNQRTEVTLWTKLYTRSVCDNDPTLYSANTCFRRCYVKKWIDVCNCMPTYHWSNFFGPNVSTCNPLNMTCDLTDANYPEIEECQALCKPLCSEWIFETSSTSSSLDSSELAYVKIAYNTLQYTQIEEVAAFTIDMAIANVGGQSGLWLGCSIITIIQAVYYMFLGCAKYMFAKMPKIDDQAQKRSKVNNVSLFV